MDTVVCPKGIFNLYPKLNSSSSLKHVPLPIFSITINGKLFLSTAQVNNLRVILNSLSHIYPPLNYDCSIFTYIQHLATSHHIYPYSYVSSQSHNYVFPGWFERLSVWLFSKFLFTLLQSVLQRAIKGIMSKCKLDHVPSLLKTLCWHLS